MKSVIRLAEERDIHEFSRSLFESHHIRRSYDSGGLVKSVVDRFARRPKFFFFPSDVEKEAPHFSPWWGGIMLREYPNKAVQDLYYLHEMEHAGTMPYSPSPAHVLDDPVTFKNKIRDNEHQASVLSEMTIYCEIPDLRTETFGHEIFVDRFLFPEGDWVRPSADILRRWREEPELLSKELMYARAAVLTSKKTFENDIAAFWLKRFYTQGSAWSKIWTGDPSKNRSTGRFGEVERAMVVFRENIDALGRSPALDAHVEWLLSDPVSEGTGIPFHTEASEFSKVYASHKEKYFEAIRRLGLPPTPSHQSAFPENWTQAS